MLPAVADTIRCPTDMSPFGEGAFAGGTVPFPDVTAIVEEESKCDVHNASAEESISGPVRR